MINQLVSTVVSWFVSNCAAQQPGLDPIKQPSCFRIQCSQFELVRSSPVHWIVFFVKSTKRKTENGFVLLSSARSPSGRCWFTFSLVIIVKTNWTRPVTLKSEALFTCLMNEIDIYASSMGELALFNNGKILALEACRVCQETNKTLFTRIACQKNGHTWLNF